MGGACSKCAGDSAVDGYHSSAGARNARQESPDPAIHDLMRRSVRLVAAQTATTNSSSSSEPPSHLAGQHHLLFKQQKNTYKSGGGGSNGGSSRAGSPSPGSEGGGSKVPSAETRLPPTRLLVRRHIPRHYEEGLSGTHIYAIRYPTDQSLPGVTTELLSNQEQAQPTATASSSSSYHKKQWRPVSQHYEVPPVPDGGSDSVDALFKPSAMSARPSQSVVDWVTVSQEHNVYIADVGLTPAHCDKIVQVTEQVCRGQYAAYTYAKQTLGCREFPPLAAVAQTAVHRVTHAILEFSQNKRLALDDREPHMVKYDVTKKERQKLDMHTDKSEWTFLIALSNGCGMDYEGGGTYFEALDATVHLSRGHALIFPGRLRHCGQRITSGLRFLLVGFLVDKSGTAKPAVTSNGAGTGGTTPSGTNEKEKEDAAADSAGAAVGHTNE